MTSKEYYDKYATAIKNDMIARNNLPHAKKMVTEFVSETFSEIKNRKTITIHEITNIIDEQISKLDEFNKMFGEVEPKFNSPLNCDAMRNLLVRKIFRRD